MINQDTICAIATGKGGAIGCIRVSGPGAIEAVDEIFISKKGVKKLQDQKGYSLLSGQIHNNENIIDDVLISVFRAPHSYTGENSVEITCHGSSYILQTVMQLLIQTGCRLASPGEYTQRAFLNGKMDLSQAEAVADLISSSSEAAHRLAINQMKGDFSKELSKLRSQLLHFTSMIELELDFSEEDVEFADRQALNNLAQQIEEAISKLAHSFQTGNAIKNGIPVAIVGETNAGKSTLLNTLLHEEKAIVSHIHGTTRDTIEDTTYIEGITFRFIDTAGIRETQDTIESLGIERTFNKLQQADIVLWIIDSTEGSLQFNNLAPQIIPLCQDKKLIVIFNKSDLILSSQKEKLAQIADSKKLEYIFISAKEHKNIAELEKSLIRVSAFPQINHGDVIVTNVRHYEALVRALDSIRRVQKGFQNHLSGDLISQDLRECIFHLSDIMGEVTNDEVLGNIFRSFCIGK